jgi:dTDP-4-dehydrorhamnose 3,5-epimerase
MEIRRLGLGGVLEVVPPRFGDERGFFSETHSDASFAEAGLNLRFVQDNHSFSAGKGVLRGLHYQLPPRAQDKLVRVVRGSIFDVAVDIRRDSPGFGSWVGLDLSAKKWNQILVPKGFAHGFVTLEDNTEVIYKVTDVYSLEHDRNIRFDDPDLGIAWPIDAGQVQLSAKDKAAPAFAAAPVFEAGQ